MTIDHVAIFTGNTERLRIFYENYFGGKSNPKYFNIETGLKSYTLTFEGDTKLQIMEKPDINVERPQACKGFSHLSFKVGSIKKVDELTATMKENGCDVRSYPRETGDGIYESCVYDPDGNEVGIIA